MRFSGGIWGVLIGVILLGACSSPPPEAAKKLKIGTGSRMELFQNQLKFGPQNLPKGWVLEAEDLEGLFSRQGQIPAIYHTYKDNRFSLFLQNHPAGFMLVRYSRAKLLVSPYLNWQWHVSEHTGERNPVQLVVGFYGGNPQSPAIDLKKLVWRGAGLPPADRLLAIGYDEMALTRGTLMAAGKMHYYTQRGGIEQTNQWHREAADLQALYQRAWPDDRLGDVVITFVGFAAFGGPEMGGIAFSHVGLSR